MGLQPGRLGLGECGPATGRLLRENGGLLGGGARGTRRRAEAGYGPRISLKAGWGTAACGGFQCGSGDSSCRKGEAGGPGAPCWEAGDKGLGPWVCTSGTARRTSPLRETEGL